MVEAAGIWELGWSAPITEAEHWQMVMRSFNVKRLNMIPISGIDARWIHEYPDISALLEDRSELTPVFVDEKAETELCEFQHPTDALYVFGKATFSPFNNMATGHLSLRIDCPTMGMLWPHQALAIVLYDRGRG